MILVILLQRFYPILVVKLARNPAISSQPSAISQPFVCSYGPGESLDLTVQKGWLNMRDFREIKVWEKAHLLTLEIYRRLHPSQQKRGMD